MPTDKEKLERTEELIKQGIPKKWPEERDLLAWYLVYRLYYNELSSKDKQPEAINLYLEDYQKLGFEEVHKRMYSVYPRFRELFIAPGTVKEQETDAIVSNVVAQFLTENKEAISEELHRQFKKTERKG